MVNGKWLGGVTDGGVAMTLNDGMEPAHYKLDVWRESMQMVRLVYDLTATFPDEEKYGLTSQMRRSAVSVPSNIAEGAARGNGGDFVRFLQIARASLMELDTQVWLSRDLGFLQDVSKIRDKVISILRMLNGLIQSRQ